MQTILGAGGIIANELAMALRPYDTDLRLVSRNPIALSTNDQLFSADFMKTDEVHAAVEGSEVVYLTVGLPYKTKLWEKAWPIILRNVVDACSDHQCRLVYFDNVYMYSSDEMKHMTEESTVAPSSRKGQARMEAAQIVVEAVEKGKVEALIARAADFYGPGNDNRSILYEMVFKNLAAGKKANWMGDFHAPHSYTFTPDAGRATALLGNSDSAYNEIWHLPTANDPWSGEKWVNEVAAAMGKSPKTQVLGKNLARVLGLFIPPLRESVEMFYQFDQPYVFDSAKFENAFSLIPTSYQEGLNEILSLDFPDQIGS